MVPTARRAPRAMPLALLALLALLPLLGCAGLPGIFQDPDFQLSEVVVRGMGLSGGTLDLVVKVQNPNGFDLRGTKLQAGFDVEDKHVGDVTFDDAFNVPRNGTATVTLPIRFDWSGVGAAFRSALSHGDIPYTFKGKAEFTVGGASATIPFTREGRAPLTRVGFTSGAGRVAPDTASPQTMRKWAPSET